MDFNNSMYKIEYKEKIVLANLNSGKWIRISKTVYEIIEYILQKNFLDNKEWDFIQEKEDRIYIKKVIEDMISIGVIINVEEDYKEDKVVLIELTHKCNLHCVHCCVSAEKDSKEFSTEQLLEIFDKVIEWKPSRILLTGGEPLSRTDFEVVLTSLRKKYSKEIVLLTNGTLINDENIKFITENINQIDISLDGVDEETCSKVRGKGVFKKVISNVKKLQNSNFDKISLSIALGDKNYHLEDEFLELNNRLGTVPVLRQFAPVGRGAKVKEQYLDDNKIGHLKEIFSEKNLKKDYTKKITACSCKAGKEVVYIDYKGDIYPCQYLIESEFKWGNIFKIKSIKELFLQNFIFMQNLKKIQPKNFENCEKCEVNIFCWPCPGELYRAKEINNYFKNSCKEIKPILMEKIWGEN